MAEGSRSGPGLKGPWGSRRCAYPDDETAPPSSVELGVRDLSLEGSIDRINLERCIERLPSGFRKIFILHDIQGYRHGEIAKLLGRSVGDSKSQLHKARKRLRELLHELQRDQARDERLATARAFPDCPSLKRLVNTTETLA